MRLHLRGQPRLPGARFWWTSWHDELVAGSLDEVLVGLDQKLRESLAGSHTPLG